MSSIGRALGHALWAAAHGALLLTEDAAVALRPFAGAGWGLSSPKKSFQESSEALVLANSVTSDTVGVVLFAIRVAARVESATSLLLRAHSGNIKARKPLSMMRPATKTRI